MVFAGRAMVGWRSQDGNHEYSFPIKPGVGKAEAVTLILVEGFIKMVLYTSARENKTILVNKTMVSVM